jgi:hypothetical protein
MRHGVLPGFRDVVRFCEERRDSRNRRRVKQQRRMPLIRNGDGRHPRMPSFHFLDGAV